MSKTSEAGIHMYMMKAHELMGVRGSSIKVFFVSTFHKYSKGDQRDHMIVHAVFMHSVSVCMWIQDEREKQILLAVLKVSFSVHFSTVYKWLTLSENKK